MRKRAILFSAGEYLDSKTFPKPSCDLTGAKFETIHAER